MVRPCHIHLWGMHTELLQQGGGIQLWKLPQVATYLPSFHPGNCRMQEFYFRHKEAHVLSLVHGWNPGCKVRPGLRDQPNCLYWVVLSVQRGGRTVALFRNIPVS